MESDRNPWLDDEVGYVRQLEHERHMFAWCLEEYGGVGAAEATSQAQHFYEYESASGRCRGLHFHDEAWHWAMLKVFGEAYWSRRPDLETASAAYRFESARFEKERGTLGS
jgi:hypothetical protein